MHSVRAYKMIFAAKNHIQYRCWVERRGADSYCWQRGRSGVTTETTAAMYNWISGNGQTDLFPVCLSQVTQLSLVTQVS